jgi:hypothetical protein
MSLLKNFSMPKVHFTACLNKFARLASAPKVLIHRIDDTNARIDIDQRVEALVRRTVAGVRVQVSGGTYDTDLDKLDSALIARVVDGVPLGVTLKRVSAVVGDC